MVTCTIALGSRLPKTSCPNHISRLRLIGLNAGPGHSVQGRNTCLLQLIAAVEILHDFSLKVAIRASGDASSNSSLQAFGMNLGLSADAPSLTTSRNLPLEPRFNSLRNANHYSGTPVSKWGTVPGYPI